MQGAASSQSAKKSCYAPGAFAASTCPFAERSPIHFNQAFWASAREYTGLSSSGIYFGGEFPYHVRCLRIALGREWRSLTMRK